MVSSVLCGVTGLVGCRPKVEPDAPAFSERSDVPLRVLLCGTNAWGEAIQTAWGGVSDQPLRIETLSLPSSKEPRSKISEDRVDSAFETDAIEALMRNDVGIVPCGLTADLQKANAFTPLGTDMMSDPEMALEHVLPIVNESMLRWAGRPIGIPLGAPLPAMLVSSGISAPSSMDRLIANGDESRGSFTWNDYIEFASELIAPASDGDFPVVAEPLAGGAAAKMFLWRANVAKPAVWLFNRENFEPVLTDETYVRTLEVMRRCARLYGDKRLTVGEVWSGVADGRIRLAIGWPGTSGETGRVEPIGDTQVFPLPGIVAEGFSQEPILIDPDSPIALMSSRCRQTAVAKRFLAWLSGGDGNDMVRGSAPSMTVTRSHSSTAGTDAKGDAYSEYLSTQLSSILSRPTLRLHRYEQYLESLDRQIMNCLDGKASPTQALQASSDAWKSITQKVGIDEQAKAWRLSQGLRN